MLCQAFFASYYVDGRTRAHNAYGVQRRQLGAGVDGQLCVGPAPPICWRSKQPRGRLSQVEPDPRPESRPRDWRMPSIAQYSITRFILVYFLFVPYIKNNHYYNLI